jgi:hypothetical protein
MLELGNQVEESAFVPSEVSLFHTVLKTQCLIKGS